MKRTLTLLSFIKTVANSKKPGTAIRTERKRIKVSRKELAMTAGVGQVCGECGMFIRFCLEVCVMRTAFLLLLAGGLPAVAQQEMGEEWTSKCYVVDNVPIAKTPQFLGLNVEVMKFAERANIWDWLADSNAGMVRAPHPATSMRRSYKEEPAVLEPFEGISSKEGFDAFRERLRGEPEKAVPWDHYLFGVELPWLGVLDEIIPAVQRSGAEFIMAMAYEPRDFPDPILKKPVLISPAPDGAINWAAAASAYEYYFACMMHCAGKHGVTRFMMRNEPPANRASMAQQFGVLSRIARMAMDDVKRLLPDRKVAERLSLSSTANYRSYEEYLTYYRDHVDLMDVHFYDTDGKLIRKKLRRALMRARQNGLRLNLTEFGRIGGETDINQILFGNKASLQVADLVMNVLGARGVDDPEFEMALLYQLQSPATHRNYKSLVYGDMNMVDWTGMDRFPQKRWPEGPDFESLQLRFATPAFDLFRMLARCTPGRSGPASHDVLEVMEANRGVTRARDSHTGRNIWPALDPRKYYAMGGEAHEASTLAVMVGDRLYVNLLNQEPVAMKDMTLDVSSLGRKFRTAVVREMSLLQRDAPVLQTRVKEGRILFNVPPESFVQIIFMPEDLGQVSELKVEEETFTPGSLAKLGVLETTRLRVMGKLDEEWIDLTEVNATFKLPKRSGLKVHGAGLVQRLESREEPEEITVELVDGAAKTKVLVK